MRRTLLTALTGLLTIGPGHAQLLQNGSFETLVDCPPDFGPDLSIQLTMAGWLTIQGTPDGYHEDCPALHPDATPGVPQVGSGSGYGALWSPNEVVGPSMAAPLEVDKHYCLDLLATAVDLLNSGVQPGDDCLRLCLYGSTEAPSLPDPWQPPTPVEDMPGVTLLACTGPVELSGWAPVSLTFQPDQPYPSLFIAGQQGGSCTLLRPYIAMDDVVLTECLPTSISTMASDVRMAYPNPTDGLLLLPHGSGDKLSVTVWDLSGRSVLQAALPGASIDLTPLPPGSYLVELRTTLGRSLQRVNRN